MYAYFRYKLFLINMICPLGDSPALSNAINLDHMVDLITHICFKDFHDISPPPVMNTKQLMDLVFFLFDI